MLAHPSSNNSANGIRTRVWALRGPRPSPLDDSASASRFASVLAPHNHNRPFSKRAINKKDLSDRPGRNRTCNPRFWRPVLYQLSYGPKPRAVLADPTARRASLALLRRSEGWLTGIEPATPGATDRCSNQLSYSHHINRTAS